MKKLLVLAVSLALVLSLAACGGDNGSPAGNNGGTTKLSSATDKWPSGVYNPLGVPEYKAGKLVYAYPNDEGGNVFYNTTREEVIAYIDSLKEKGFHMYENNYESLKTKSWESFEVYFPNPGGKYALSVIYSWENDGKGNNTELYEEDSGEVFTIDYNLCISLINHGAPEGWNTKNLLTSVGLTDDMLMIENANKIISGVNKSDMMSVMAASKGYLYAGMGIGFAFDYNLTKEFLIDYELKLLDACKSISDDGKVTGIFGDLNMEEIKTKGCSAWIYNYNGKKLSVQIFAETGYDAGISVIIMETK